MPKLHVNKLGAKAIPLFCLRCGLMLMSGDYCDACKDELREILVEKLRKDGFLNSSS